MLATSEAVLAAWLSPARQLAVRVQVDQSSYGSEDVTSLSFDSGSISGEVYQIGSTYMNTVQIVFPSIIETIKEDQEVIPELGILVDGEYHYSKLGHFFITEFNRDRNAKTTTIVASDKMIYMEGVYESKLTYSKPYREVALEIANLAGVEINQASFASLGTLAIKKPVGYTHRQAIGLIAQFEGGFASFNRDGELEIRRLRPTDFEVTPESYLLKGFTKNENAYRIGGITVRIGEEETDVLRVGSTNGSQVELENKVMTQTLLNNIWALVKDLNYFPFELKWRGCPLLEAGDWMYVTDRDGNRYSVPNLSYSLTFNGGLSGESKATTNSSSQATYKYRGSLKQKVDWLDSILSANNWNSNYYDATEPSAPKEGDAWFKPNGQDIEIWVYEKDAEGNLDWVFKISTATDPALIALIEENKRLVEEAQSAAEEAQKAGEDAQKVADEAKDKADQAGVDAGQALDKANDAVSKANDATQKVDGLETAVGLVTEQSANAVDVANQAKSNADTALGKANSTIGTAQDALNQSALAKSQAEEAIEKYLGMGMVPAWSWSPDGTDRFTTVYPGENLVTLASLGRHSNASVSNVNFIGPGRVNINSDGRDYIGFYTAGRQYQLSTRYSMKFKMVVNSGSVTRIGGHTTYTYSIQDASINGVSQSLNWANGIGYNFENNKEYTVSIVFTTRDTEAMYTDPSAGIFIQPNRMGYGTAFDVDISELKIEEYPATIYTPAPSEDYANAVPSYIGFAIEPSDNPADYTWIRNPEKVEGEVKVELTEINGELSRKVSQETFDQLNSTVINHSTLIIQNQNAIKLKADQSTVDTINQTVADHSTAIDLNAEAIALKANQSTVDTLNNTVSSLNSQLTVQAGKISGLTTVTDGHTTKIGALELRAGQFSLSLSDVRNDLDGMEIGGRNWMPASEAEWVTDKMYSNSAYGIYRTGLNGVYEHLVDNKVMISFEVFIENTVDENATVSVYGLNGTPKYELLALNLTGIKTNQWVRVSGNIKIQKHATNTSESRIEFYGNGNTNTSKIRIRKLKLEKGTKATDWTPAPEDMATVTALTEVKATVDSLTMTVADKADKTTVTQLANQWQQTTDLANGHTSQISSLGDAINLRVEKDDIINQININEQGVLIAGEKVHITGLTTIDDAVIKTANIVDLNVTEAKLGNLSVSTAKIADAAITSAKIGTAAIGTAHIGDGVITTAKIGDAQITGAKIQDATIDTAKIISLDANKLVANTLSAITTNTGALNVTGWLTFATENRGLIGTYDFGDPYGSSYNTRWYTGDYRLSHRHLVHIGKIYKVNSNDTKGSYLYDAQTYFGNDYLKMRTYNSAGTLLNRIDINSDGITMGDGEWGSNSKIALNADGSAAFGSRVNFNAGIDVAAPDGVGIRTGRIDAALNYDSFKINAERPALCDVTFGPDNVTFNGYRTSSADFTIGKDGSATNGGRVVSSMAIYNRTYSGAANMYVTTAGTLGRTTSARKYKADIQPAYDVIAKAKKVLELNPSSWWDKGELADGVAKERYYGFIADEFAEAGLNEVVVYRDGEIESLAYDRIPMYHNVILSEHEKEIQELKEKVQQLENEIRVLQAA